MLLKLATGGITFLPSLWAHRNAAQYSALTSHMYFTHVMHLQLAAREAQLQQACDQSNAAADQLVRRMLIELETGGNVRFEEAINDSQWAASCRELVQARCLLDNSSGSVAVRRITRIHNRALRNRYLLC